MHSSLISACLHAGGFRRAPATQRVQSGRKRALLGSRHWLHSQCLWLHRTIRAAGCAVCTTGCTYGWPSVGARVLTVPFSSGCLFGALDTVADTVCMPYHLALLPLTALPINLLRLLILRHNQTLQRRWLHIVKTKKLPHRSEKPKIMDPSHNSVFSSDWLNVIKIPIELCYHM